VNDSVHQHALRVDEDMSLFAVDLLACEFAPKKFLRRSRSNYLTAKENLALRRDPARCKSHHLIIGMFSR